MNLNNSIANTIAQIGNLLYRRLATGERCNGFAPADFQSAIQQVNNLRYAKRFLEKS